MRATARMLYGVIMADDEARKKVMNAADADEAVGVVVGLGRRFGLPVSEAEVYAFFNPPEGELNDAELEGVVGGKIEFTQAPGWFQQ